MAGRLPQTRRGVTKAQRGACQLALAGGARLYGKRRTQTHAADSDAGPGAHSLQRGAGSSRARGPRGGGTGGRVWLEAGQRKASVTEVRESELLGGPVSATPSKGRSAAYESRSGL